MIYMNKNTKLNMYGMMNKERFISGSYNGSTPGSEPVNEGPIPSPEAMFYNHPTLIENRR